jgi:hypothetical protein
MGEGLRRWSEEGRRGWGSSGHIVRLLDITTRRTSSGEREGRKRSRLGVVLCELRPVG